jgi:Flp pilus assembly protein, ATPase CpaF
MSADGRQAVMPEALAETKVLEDHALRVFRTSLSVLSGVLDDPDVQEVMVNRPDEVWIERGGSMQRLSGIRIANAHVESAVRALASGNNKGLQPVLDCRMPGYRIAAALPPVAIQGAAICIRKHARSRRTLESYLSAGGFGPLPEDLRHDLAGQRPPDEAVAQGGQALRDLLRWAVRARKNFIIAGSTGSGKTTFLNALLAEVPPDQRVLTIEDTAELQVTVPNCVGLEAAPDQGITIRSLVRLALRFRPDRIFVGEVRGAESYDLLDAMNTGHPGGGCSLHADSPLLALSRMESLVRMNPDTVNLPHQALRKQIASTFDFIVFCSRRGWRRGPEQVMEVLGADEHGYHVKTLFDARTL